ncbi:MAG TPA: ATPase [Firmicutes bacterium]|jgi:N-acetylglucosamine kinase|nr:ATPase [Bacillota bacterium]HBK68636.1 ATPase [Bacillota bacterium]
MSYFLGIDGGGTKTISYLANEKGEILGRGEAGASAYHVTGIKKAVQEIRRTIDQAMPSGPKQITPIETACFGLAGIDSQQDYDTIYQVLTEQQISQQLVLENDAVIALVGGNAKPYGVVLIAGTGAISLGINKQGQRKRAGGWGHIIGDEGSGYDIAISGLTAALKAYDGRGEDTILLPMFKKKLALNSMEDIMEKVYFSLSREEIASMAYIIFQAAQKRDRVAEKIIIKAGNELAQNIKAVINGLQLAGEEIEIPLVGGVFKNESSLLIDVIKKKVLRSAPKAKILKPRFEPAIGAVIMALSQSGVKVDQKIMDNLKRTII